MTKCPGWGSPPTASTTDCQNLPAQPVLGNAGFRETNFDAAGMRQSGKASSATHADAVEFENLHRFSILMAKSQSRWPLSGQLAIAMRFPCAGVGVSVGREAV